eukprot:12813876-Alexandrium_andersonii.AAC.1
MQQYVSQAPPPLVEWLGHLRSARASVPGSSRAAFRISGSSGAAYIGARRDADALRPLSAQLCDALPSR